MSWNDTVIADLRAGKERIADTFDRDKLLLLHTTGARSGQARLHPVAYLDKGDHLVIVASKAGADTHPAWYHNLLVHPLVTLERWVDGRVVTQTAHAKAHADGEERDRIWAEVTGWSQGFADYQEKTDRVIPVVVLHPTA